MYLLHRDQSGNGREPGGHREHAAVAADAQVLEGKALGVEATGKPAPRWPLLCLFALEIHFQRSMQLINNTARTHFIPHPPFPFEKLYLIT